MKFSVRVAQILVGLLFIVSGLVKANDPIGLAYKMQEFFELWSAGFSQGSFVRGALDFFHRTSLPLSVFMITLEIAAGVALLIGWRKKFVLWVLLALIVFFTFLTGYAYLSGKFTNCGCFGDCLPIPPLASFLKDVALLALIGFLLMGQRFIKPVSTPGMRTALLSLSLILSLALQWYVLNYLPIADCLPFKKGNNIAEQMKPPPGSRPDSTATYLLYEKGGKQYEWLATQIPADFQTYKYVNTVTKVIRKGNNRPPVEGFELKGVTGIDSTQIILEQEKAAMVFAMDFKDRSWLPQIKELVQAARQKQTPVYVVSLNAAEGRKAFEEAGITGLSFFNPDYVVVRVVARTTPTVLFLKKGTVTAKYSKQGIEKATAELTSGRF